MSESLANDNNTCVVCFKNVVFFSIGECDHPVCFECSTRMRVLCLTNECPICRKDLSRVVFTDTVLPYKELCTTVFPDRLFERQFKIGFCNEKIKDAYCTLLEHCCQLCPKSPPYRTFTMLNDHMRKAHERYFCDLCVKHLKIFTNERKCYTRQELAHHRRKGDLDDTSHRGHPLCEFCEERFMDADELYRHLRKEHLYCHLCDADGRNFYYATHTALQQHFRTDHFLCEEGECAKEYLTAVFRSEIDLKAHKATVHGRNMPRGAARQARTLELQFNITPHPVATRGPPARAESPPGAAPAPRVDTSSDAQFPRLSAACAPAPLAPAAPAPLRGTASLARTDKNFPALDGSGPSRPAPPVTATIVRNSKPSVSVQMQRAAASASDFRLTQPAPRAPPPASRPPRAAARPPRDDDDDFPALGPVPRDDHPSLGAATMQPPKMTMINSQEMQALQKPQKQSQPKKQAHGTEAFPALSSTTTPAKPPMWITIPKGKEKKITKPEPPPQPKQPSFNQVADFPTLPANKSKSKKKQETPQPKPQIQLKARTPNQPPPQIQTEVSKPSKKDKRKQNINRKENIEEDLVEDADDRSFNHNLNYVSSVNNNSTESDRKIKTVESTSALPNDQTKNKGNGDFALAAKDYPPLSGKSANILPQKVIEYKPQKKMPNGNIPPGFKSRPACDGMTFTNSAGQTFPAPVHTYISPPNFEIRNRALVQRFAVALGGPAAVEDFKVASRAFRDSIIGADEFYQHCQEALGSQLDSVFPELVALLPDIAKQQELVVGRDLNSKLIVCTVCGQLVTATDSIAHDTAHWPPLSSR